MIYSILYVFGVIFIALGGFIIFSSTIGFIRHKDFFIKVQAVSISNLYGINLLFLGESMKDFDLKSFLIALIIIFINSASTLVVIHSLTRFAFIENVKSKAINRKDLKRK